MHFAVSLLLFLSAGFKTEYAIGEALKMFIIYTGSISKVIGLSTSALYKEATPPFC